ncbi:MAG: cupin domain-containing protein [Pseudomonadota bacterium]
MENLSAQELISRLDLSPHPEGGHFRETFRDENSVDGRSVGTAILFMLKAGETSHWHRVDASEIWHFYTGAPLELRIAEKEATPIERKLLGIELSAGQSPQIVIPAGYWQSATTTGEWTLVGCTVSPGFEFSGFEMAEQGWSP